MTDYIPPGAVEFTTPGKGERPYNNPGNLRKPGDATGFMQYPTLEAGRVALEQDLIAKGKRGPTTIAKFLQGYSPSTENDTSALISNMSKRLGLGPNDKLDLADPTIRAKVAHAVQIQEGYTPIDLPSGVGGGRGKQGGPTAAQNAERSAAPTVAPTPEKKSGVGLDDLASFTANIGRTVTFGGTDYIPQFFGGMSPEEMKAFYTKDAAEHEGATTGGKFAGQVVQGILTGGPIGSAATKLATVARMGKAGTAATQIAAQGAGNAVLGGVQEAVDNPDATPEDIARAAAISGAFGAGGQTVAEVGKYGVAKYVASQTAKVNQASAKINAQVADQIAERNAKLAAEQAAAERAYARSLPDSGPVPPKPAILEQQPMRALPDAPITPEQYRATLQSTKRPPDPEQSFRQYLQDVEAGKPSTLSALARGVKTTTTDLIKEAIPNLATGAALGTGMYLAGDDEDPMRLAKAAGATALGAWKGKALANAAAQYSIMHPNAARYGEQFLVGSAKGAGLAAAPYGKPEQIPPEPPKSLIQQTIDDYDARRAARQVARPQEEYVPPGAIEYVPPGAVEVQ
jgi:hypothetical protein